MARTTTRRDLLKTFTFGLSSAVMMGCVAGCSTSSTRTTTKALTQQPPARPKIKRELTPQPPPPTDAIPSPGAKLALSEEEWKQRLSPLQFEILRQDGTEIPYTGTYLKEKRAGTYHCAACNNPLFGANAKFDSRTGWPSFWDRVSPDRVATAPDARYDMTRIEVFCAHCEGHLGHVFDDGPQPTGKRYCVNSVSLYFRPDPS